MFANTLQFPSTPAPREIAPSESFAISVATPREREEIYRIRHQVYAWELGQHGIAPEGALRDALDEGNIYLAGRIGGELAGFISVTPPSLGRYSIDKYFSRDTLPFPVNDSLYEIRLLTVIRARRGRELAMLLMYAAYRWVESHGGEHLVAIGRREILDLYLKVGLRPLGRSTRSGAVSYDLLHADVGQLQAAAEQFGGLLARLESKTRWNLNFAFHKPAACFHGGRFFSAIGERFDDLQRKDAVINADVLDAWFPPSPRVAAALRTHLEWLMRTSPPTGCEGLVATIAEVRGVRPANILPGAGSSDLIFRAFRQWLGPDSHVLILDPTYGEYAHVLERVIGCTVDRLPLLRAKNYEVDLADLQRALQDDYDLVALVNPNSPTGRSIPRDLLEGILRTAQNRTRIWIDETYIEYVGQSASMESFAAGSENVIVCKSMSKAYALSGMRVAYLCAGAHQLESLRGITPPWVVGLPSQLAATVSLRDPEYYRARYQETDQLRDHLSRELEQIGWEVIPGCANFLLCHLPEDGPTAQELARECRQQGLFIRDAALMGSGLGDRAVRIAVKDAQTTTTMLRILKSAQCSSGARTLSVAMA